MQGQPVRGGFYEHELQKTSNSNVYLSMKVLEHTGNKVKVHWLSFDKSQDGWIDSNNVL